MHRILLVHDRIGDPRGNVKSFFTGCLPLGISAICGRMTEAENLIEEGVRRLGGPSRTVVKLAQAGYTLSESGLRHWRQMGRITDAHGCMLFAELTGLP